MRLGVLHGFHMAKDLGRDHACLSWNVSADHQHHTKLAHGVVLMLGGNIPGQTQVVSTQIYGHVEAMEYAQAHWLAAGMVVFSFLVLLALMRLQRKPDRLQA